jgi:hypothetical protein
MMFQCEQTTRPAAGKCKYKRAGESGLVTTNATRVKERWGK